MSHDYDLIRNYTRSYFHATLQPCEPVHKTVIHISDF